MKVAQNIESKGLICKICRNKDLAAKIGPKTALFAYILREFFFSLDAFGISNLDKKSRKISEFKGLIAKIFVNQDLAFAF
jgi:hypothetical protein